MTLPKSPAAAERGITNSCFMAISFEHLVVRNPTKTNVKPMTLPAAKAAKNPVFVTPPLVPFRTD